MKHHSICLLLYLALLINSQYWWFDSNAIDMTLKGGTSQACAACKFQRRRCHSECPLAPYFPPDQPKMFQNAHKLFGVSNILKILKNLDADQKTEAMRSIIHQANIRDKYPVHGCWGVICQLRYQIWQAEEELHAVLAQLDMYRQHFHQGPPGTATAMPEDENEQQQQHIHVHVPSQQLELGMAPPNNGLTLFNQNQNQNPQPPYNGIIPPALPISHQQHSMSNNNYSPTTYIDSKDSIPNSMWIQQSYNTNGNNSNSMATQSQLQEMEQGYDEEMHPYFDTIDDRQSYIDTKEPYDTRFYLVFFMQH